MAVIIKSLAESPNSIEACTMDDVIGDSIEWLKEETGEEESTVVEMMQQHPQLVQISRHTATQPLIRRMIKIGKFKPGPA